MAVSQWVRSLTEDVVGPSTLSVGGHYLHPDDGEIEITSGRYWGERGISNFWRWTVVSTGEQKYGYGGHWPRVEKKGGA